MKLSLCCDVLSMMRLVLVWPHSVHTFRYFWHATFTGAINFINNLLWFESSHNKSLIKWLSQVPCVVSDGCISDNDMIIIIMMLNNDDSDDDVVVVLKIYYLEGLDMAPSYCQGPALEQETTLTNIPQAPITIPSRLLLQNCKNHRQTHTECFCLLGSHFSQSLVLERMVLLYSTKPDL